jgi:enolase
MQSVKNSLFSKLLIWVIVGAFCLNSSGVAFAMNNLKPLAAAKNTADLKSIEDELIRTHNKDGGKLTESQIVHAKRNLGANAVLGPSAAMTRAAADAKDIPLFQYIAQYLGNHPDKKKFTPEDFLKAVRNVNIVSNVINGGAHAGWSTDNQEYMVDPGFGREMAAWLRTELLHGLSIQLDQILKSPADLTRLLQREIREPFPTGKADEGGVAPKQFRNNEEPLKVLTEAITRTEKKLGLEKGTIKISMDFAISDLYKEDGLYHFKAEKDLLTGEPLVLTTEQVIGIEEGWINNYDIASLEDGIAERDPKGWTIETDRLGQKVLVIGDDFTYTNLEKLLETIKKEQINTILIKINQNGSISGTIQVIQHALLNGISVAISHRSGETEDDFIAHLAIAANLFEKKADKFGRMPMVLLKSGAFRQSDRVAKYNTLLRVEAYLERVIAGLAPKINQPGVSPTAIIDVYGLEIYDSRGNPTTETVITLNNGKIFRNALPSGASTGENESIELRDKVFVQQYPFRITEEFVRRVFPYNPEITVEKAKKILSERVSGKGVQVAVYNINYLIAPKLIGKDVAEFDSLEKMIELGDGEMFKLELALERESEQYAFAGGSEVIAIVGGTGDMGKALADRLRLAGLEVLIGSRKADPAMGILANAEAVKRADVVIFALKAQFMESNVSDLAQYLKKNAIVLSIAAPFSPVFEANKPPVLTYTPPEGYVSSGQQVQTIINKKVPQKNIQVVSAGIQSVPAEWMANPAVTLNQEIIVSGDEKTCSLACAKVLNKINKGLKTVISGTLNDASNVEALTPRIVASKKEILAIGSRPVSELVAFVKERGANVSTKELVAYNREKLDPALRQRYADAKVFAADTSFIADAKVSIEEREVITVGLRRYADLIEEKDLIKKQQVKKALARFDVDSNDTGLIDALSGNIDEMIKVIKKFATGSGALVFKAETILKNAGSVAKLRAIREAGLPVRVIVWTNDDNEAAALELIGVSEVADIRKDKLEDVFSELERDNQISAKQTVAIGFEKDNELPDSAKDVIVFDLQAAQTMKKGVSQINVMSLIIDKALVMIFNKKEVTEVTKAFEEVSNSYAQSNKINEYELSQFNDQKIELFEVPLAKVNEDVAKFQIAYDAVMAAI